MSTAIEIFDAGTYTRVDFQHDLRAVEKAAKAREAVVERVRTWDRTNSLDVARRLLRMRDSDHWRGPGTRGTDREFYEWLIGEEHVTSTAWARDLVMAGRALSALEAGVKSGDDITNLPVGASQIIRLGSTWFLERPKAIARVWWAAVDDANGQPSQELVAQKARRYKADLQSVEDTDSDALAVRRQLRRIRKRLIGLYHEEPAMVHAFLRELSVSIPDEARDDV